MCQAWCDLAIRAYHKEGLSVDKTLRRLSENGYKTSNTTLKKYLQKHGVYRVDPRFYGSSAKTGWMSIKRSTTQCEHCKNNYEPISRTQRWCKVCCPAIEDTVRMAAYGINRAEYDALVERAQSRCEICGSQPERALHLDHCYKTGRVRGLLCSACNRTLGHVETRIDWINRLQVYLTRI